MFTNNNSQPLDRNAEDAMVVDVVNPEMGNVYVPQFNAQNGRATIRQLDAISRKRREAEKRLNKPAPQNQPFVRRRLTFA